MKKVCCLVLVLMVVGLAMPKSASAETYVSLRGGFYLTYPDTWRQVDYLTVDYFLQQIQASDASYNYEVVLSAAKPGAFYDNEYAIITIDTSGEFSRPERDSILRSMGEIFDDKTVSTPLDGNMTNVEVRVPTYDAKRGLIVVLSDIEESPDVLKRNFTVTRFYNKGLVNFYFYAPDSTFESVADDIDAIVSSFSTDDIESHLPKEKLTLADPTTPSENSGASGGMVRSWVPWTGGAAIVIILVVLRLRKGKNK